MTDVRRLALLSLKSEAAGREKSAPTAWKKSKEGGYRLGCWGGAGRVVVPGKGVPAPMRPTWRWGWKVPVTIIDRKARLKN